MICWICEMARSVSLARELEHLDPQDLKVQGTGSNGAGESRTPVFDAGGGYDPYNQGEPRTRTGIPKKGGRGKR
jgi:hypothetical protein